MSERKIGINVSIDPDSVESLGRVIMRILESHNDQHTKQAALTILPAALGIKNVNIHGNAIEMREDAKVDEIEEVEA